MGGRSSEHPVSLRSGAAVAEGLTAAGHEVTEVTIARDGTWSSGGEEVTLTPGGGLLGCDAAFPILHGPFGEDGTVQGVLESLDLPYVGPGVLAAAVCMDKLSLKSLFGYHGIPQVGFCEAAGEGWRERCAELGLPVWVKPSRLGSSVGISRVDDAAQLDAAVAEARRHDPRVIVEAHADGREIECSVIGNEELEVSPPGELQINADWYDFEAKYEQGGMDLVVPAELPDGVSEEIREMAARVYRLAGCTGLARCDFFVVDGDQVLVNEINTLPGFTETSVFSKLFEAGGVGYAELCDRLVGLAVERHERERSFEF